MIRRRLGAWLQGPTLSVVAATIHRYRGTVVEVDGIRLKMDRRLSNFMANLLRRGEHAVEERALVLPALEADDVVMELGGGVGHTSTRFAKIVGSDRVFTFEANPELEPLMRENFRLNGVSPAAEFCMLGQREGRAPFYVHRHFWVSSQVPSDGGRQIEVPVQPINDRIHAINPSFLVVDIEGGEREVFDGLDFHNVRKVMLELHEHVLGAEETERVLRSIAAAGFVLDRQMGSCRLFRRSLMDDARRLLTGEPTR
jgi:FkbM family methyltransferase